MATLYVRNLPANLYGELRRWANDHDRSVNAEVIDLLRRERERRLGTDDAAQTLSKALAAPLVTADRRVAEATVRAVLLPE